MPKDPPDLSIAAEKVCFIVVKAREFDVKDVVTDPDDASNASDDNMISVLEDHVNDPVADELRGFIGALNEDEQTDLVALAWLGRGDGTAFAARHPSLHVQLLLEDRRQDLVRDAVDVAIRLGRLIDSTATAKLIATIPRVVVASPDYLVRHGVPAPPNELVQHRIVGGTAAAVPTAWMFERDGKESVVPLKPHFSTNENEGAIAAAVAGFGITSTSVWACRRELEDGSLVRLFLGWKMVGIPVHAYFPMGPATRAAGRAAVDHLVADFQRGGDAISS